MMSNRNRGRLVFSTKQLVGAIHIGLLCMMLVLKVLRAYSGAAGTGGVWNYIQLFFIASGLILTIRYAKIHTRQAPVAIFIVFGIVTFGIAMTKLTTFSMAQMFNLVTIPYGPMMLVWVYYLSLNDRLRSMYKYVYWVYYIMAAITVYAMIRYRGGAVAESGAVADVYYVVALMPFALYHIRKRNSGVLIRRSAKRAKKARYSVDWRVFLPVLAAAAGTMMTGKRAGLLAVVAMFLAYFLLISRQQKDGKRQLRLISLFLALTFAALMTLQVLDVQYDLDVVERLMRLSEDGGSNRDVIWAARISALSQASPMQLLFGYAANPFAGHAHNDFLELMVLYGVFPVLLYVGYFVSLVRVLIRMQKTGYPYAAEFSAAIISAFFLSMFSFFVIDPTYITSHAFSTGVILADYRTFTKSRGRLR